MPATAGRSASHACIHRRSSPWLVVPLILCTVLPLHAQSRDAGVQQLFDLYAAHRYGELQSALEALDDFSNVRREAERLTPSWPPERAAGFLLEVAAAAFRLEMRIQQALWAANRGVDLRAVAPDPSLVERLKPRHALRLLELGCARTRERDTDRTFAVTWHLAVLSLLQGVGDPTWLEVSAGGLAFRQHLNHIAGFISPEESAMANAVLREQYLHELSVQHDPTLTGRRVFGDISLSSQVESRRRKATEEAFASLQTAAVSSTLADEALLRRGHLHALRNGPNDATEALRLFDLVRAGGSEWSHLASLFKGRVLERDRRIPEALAAFREASAAAPASQSGTIALAALLFATGSTTEAEALIGRAVSTSATNDPWAWYLYGTFKSWPDRLDALRGRVR